MKNTFAKNVLLATLVVVLSSFVFAKETSSYSTQKVAYSSGQRVFTLNDMRVEKLTAFFNKYNSPLTPYAPEFIKAADFYNVDWKLVPAITGVESTFGKRIPYKSYNAYGWNNGVYKFESWEQSIWHVTKILRERYMNRGATSVQTISRIYAPPSSTWAGKVNFFMGKIEKTSPPTLDL
ncbi:MAG: hypothetical protein Q8Q15_03040 [bacterium]|nr:hypothetical protein [bacterium]